MKNLNEILSAGTRFQCQLAEHAAPHTPHFGHRKPRQGSEPTSSGRERMQEAQHCARSSGSGQLSKGSLSGGIGAHRSHVQSNCLVLFNDLTSTVSSSCNVLISTTSAVLSLKLCKTRTTCCGKTKHGECSPMGQQKHQYSRQAHRNFGTLSLVYNPGTSNSAAHRCSLPKIQLRLVLRYS